MAGTNVDPSTFSETNQTSRLHFYSVASDNNASMQATKREVDEPIQDTLKLNELRKVLDKTESD